MFPHYIDLSVVKLAEEIFKKGLKIIYIAIKKRIYYIIYMIGQTSYQHFLCLLVNLCFVFFVQVLHLVHELAQ